MPTRDRALLMIRPVAGIWLQWQRRRSSLGSESTFWPRIRPLCPFLSRHHDARSSRLLVASTAADGSHTRSGLRSTHRSRVNCVNIQRGASRSHCSRAHPRCSKNCKFSRCTRLSSGELARPPVCWALLACAATLRSSRGAMIDCRRSVAPERMAVINTSKLCGSLAEVPMRSRHRVNCQ